MLTTAAFRGYSELSRSFQGRFEQTVGNGPENGAGGGRWPGGSSTRPAKNCADVCGFVRRQAVASRRRRAHHNFEGRESVSACTSMRAMGIAADPIHRNKLIRVAG